MPLLKSCCICIPAKTGAMALGTVGIVASGAILAPIVIFLENHSFYITQFALTERNRGNYIDDENVPEMEYFSKALYTAVLALDVSHIFSCILLLVGLTTSRHLLLMPWLGLMGAAILILLTFVISFIISLADYSALAACLGSSPVLLVLIYCWLVVLSAFQTIRKNRRKATTTSASTTSRRVVALPESSSMFSVSSFRDGVQRVLGCTPPPPYEAVNVETGSLKSLEPPESQQEQLLLFHSPLEPTPVAATDLPAGGDLAASDSRLTRRRSPIEAQNGGGKWQPLSPSLKVAKAGSQMDLRASKSGDNVTIRKATSLFADMNLCSSALPPGGAGEAVLQTQHQPLVLIAPEQDASLAAGMEDEEDKACTWSSSLSSTSSSLSSTSLKSPSITNILV